MIVTRDRNTEKNKTTGKITVRILLVEDEPIFQQLHFLMLEELGCQVDVVERGEQALASLTNHYDLILMDIGLPDMRGTVVIDRIRQGSLVNKNIPIIVLTAYRKSDVEEECLSVGAAAVFNKPVASEDFAAILKKYVINE